jgi:hypothetical protein
MGLLQAQDVGGPQGLRRDRKALQNDARVGGLGLIERSPGLLLPFSCGRMALLG